MQFFGPRRGRVIGYFVKGFGHEIDTPQASGLFSPSSSVLQPRFYLHRR